jgi:hypothetical protein
LVPHGKRRVNTAAKISAWRDEFLAGEEAELKRREVAIESEELRRLKSVVAELAPTGNSSRRRSGIWRVAALWAGGRSDESAGSSIRAPAEQALAISSAASGS